MKSENVHTQTQRHYVHLLLASSHKGLARGATEPVSLQQQVMAQADRPRSHFTATELNGSHIAFMFGQFELIPPTPTNT